MAPIKEKDFPKLRNRSRLETNLIRLLSRCEEMAMNTETLSENWRLEKVCKEQNKYFTISLKYLYIYSM